MSISGNLPISGPSPEFRPSSTAAQPKGASQLPPDMPIHGELLSANQTVKGGSVASEMAKSGDPQKAVETQSVLVGGHAQPEMATHLEVALYQKFSQIW